ncbi:hypothetical protein D3C86_2038860 [compost metagenome]
MEGNRLARHIEMLGNRIHILGLLGQHTDDRPAGRIGNGLIYISSCSHNMQVFACKYICKHLLAQYFFVNFEVSEKSINLAHPPPANVLFREHL